MSPEEYIARMNMKKNMPQEEVSESIVDIAEPVTEESFMANAPDYKRDMSFIQQPKPEPNMLEQAGSYIADSALNKSLNAGMGKLGAAASGAGSSAMAGLSGAGSGMMAGLGALGPIGLGLGGMMLAKKFGLFNQGGAVGPLSPQYKERGGLQNQYREDEMSHRSKNMRVPYPGFTDFARMTGRNIWGSDEVPMWEKLMMTGTIPLDYGMSKLKHRIGDWNSNAINYNDPMVLDPGEVHQSMVLGPLSDINYKNQGGEATSKPQSTKIEKKETIEYKN